MLTFLTRWNPQTDLWQYEERSGVWSQPMSQHKLMAAMKNETLATSASAGGFGKPIAHAPRSHMSTEDSRDEYEIYHGRVIKIGKDKKERKEIKQNSAILELF